MGKLIPIDLTNHMREHNDSWANLVTQIGTANDKRLQSRVFWEMHTPEFFEQLYTGDELASRIVNVVPEEALRKGWEYTNVDKKVAIEVKKRADDLDLKGVIDRSWRWGRAYGGAVTYIVTDTSDPASPLEKGEQVIGLRDLSRYDLRILTTDVETDFGSPNWGHPRIYYLVVQMGSSFKGYPIHWTRMVRFDGYLVPRRTYIRNNYWHDSILNRLYNAIRNYQSSNDAAASVLQDFNVGIYKMKNLANLISADKTDIVQKRIEMLNYSKSVIRAMILDADDEEFEDLSRSVDGLAELLAQQANRLVAATDIPHTKLLGESPDGSNATGNSTTLQWFDHIQSEQENYLRPKLRRLLDAIFYDIPDLDFKFKPLQQLTDLEQAELRNKQAQTDQIYLTTGVLDPSEIADSRFGGDEYSVETKLDKEARDSGFIGAGSGMGQDLFGQGGEQTVPLEAEGEEEEEESKPTPPQPKRSGVETDNPGTQFDFRNQSIEAPEKKKAFISQTMSEPMRDPQWDPKIKPGGKPNKPRTIMPTVGNGMTAPSGGEYKADGEAVQKVGVVGVVSNNKLLMGKRRDSGKWVLPGGRLEDQETSAQGAARELKEESGLEVPHDKLHYVGTSMGKTDEGLFNIDAYVVNVMEPIEATGENDPDQEVEHWEWVDIEKGLPPHVADSLHHDNVEPFKQLGVL